MLPGIFIRSILQVKLADVCHHCPADAILSPRFMNVATHRQSRLYLLYASSQAWTASMLVMRIAIPEAMWRTMEEKNIRFVGNQLPLLLKLVFFEVECPIVKDWLPGCAPDVKPKEFDAAVLKVMPGQGRDQVWSILKDKVMIACHANYFFCRRLTQPVPKGSIKPKSLFQLAAIRTEIASQKEQIAIRNLRQVAM